MTRTLAQRELALAAIALLAIVAAVALASAVRGSGDEDDVPGPVGTWYDALAGAYRLDADEGRTECGYRATSELPGVAHPVLPCGAKIVIEYDGRQVLTQVVDRGTGVPGRVFDLTAPLASELGLRGVQEIRWAYAG